jgi:P27 family predicted phage terminase small subunit
MKPIKHQRPKPPDRLSPAAASWWTRLCEEYVFETADALMCLETVMDAFDRATAAREQVANEGITITDRFGQVKSHPATVVERDARMSMLRALKQLNLDVVPPGTPGRPAGGKR